MTMELVTYNGDVTDLVTQDDRGKAVMDIGGSSVRLMDQISIYYQMVQPGSVKANPTLFKNRSCQFYLRTLDDREEDELAEDADINFVDSLRALPVGLLGYSMVLFPEYESGVDQEPLCRSYDGFFPASSVTEPYSAQCAKWREKKGTPGVYEPGPICPKAIWVDRNKPECSLIQDFVFFDLDLKIPFVLPLKSTGIGAFNSLVRRFTALEVNASRRGHYADDYFIRISATNDGTYNKLVFKFEHDESGESKKHHPVALWYTEKVLPVIDPETISDDPDNRTQEEQGPETPATESGELSEEDRAAAEEQMKEAAGFEV